MESKFGSDLKMPDPNAILFTTVITLSIATVLSLGISLYQFIFKLRR